jgi:hypothetical protein
MLSNDASRYIIENHNGEMRSCDLADETKTTSYECIPYTLVHLDDRGYRETVTGEMLWFPAIGRAGIAWGGGANWTDADSPEDALQRWVSGEMRE